MYNIYRRSSFRLTTLSHSSFSVCLSHLRARMKSQSLSPMTSCCSCLHLITVSFSFPRLWILMSCISSLLFRCPQLPLKLESEVVETGRISLWVSGSCSVWPEFFWDSARWVNSPTLILSVRESCLGLADNAEQTLSHLTGSSNLFSPDFLDLDSGRGHCGYGLRDRLFDSGDDS